MFILENVLYPLLSRGFRGTNEDKKKYLIKHFEGCTNIYICCFISSSVYEFIKEKCGGKGVSIYINSNSYNLNGYAGEKPDDPIFSEGGLGSSETDKKRGVLNMLLNLENVYLVNPAQLPLDNPTDGDSPLSYLMRVLKDIYNTIGVNYELRDDKFAKEKFEEEIKYISKHRDDMDNNNIWIPKLKNINSPIKCQEDDKCKLLELIDIQATLNVLETKFNEINSLFTTNPTIKDWQQELYTKYNEIKLIVGENYYGYIARNIEKYYTAILPGYFKLTNDALGMYFCMKVFDAQEKSDYNKMKTKDISNFKSMLENGGYYLNAKQFAVKLNEVKIEDKKFVMDGILNDFEDDDVLAVWYGMKSFSNPNKPQTATSNKLLKVATQMGNNFYMLNNQNTNEIYRRIYKFAVGNDPDRSQFMSFIDVIQDERKGKLLKRLEDKISNKNQEKEKDEKLLKNEENVILTEEDLNEVSQRIKKYKEDISSQNELLAKIKGDEQLPNYDKTEETVRNMQDILKIRKGLIT